MTDINPYIVGSGTAATPSLTLPAWGIAVYLKDTHGNPTNTNLPGYPDVSFVITTCGNGNFGPPAVDNMPDVSGVGSATGALGAGLLTAIKTFMDDFDWTGSYDWSANSIDTPVSVESLVITQIENTASDVTP